MMFWHTFWRIFVRSPAAAPPYQPNPFHLVLLLIQITRGWEKSSQFLAQAVESVGGATGSQSGLISNSILSGPLAPHRSGRVPETGRLYSTMTHHTHNTLHVPGFLYLDLFGLSLLVRKWGLILPHPVRSVTCPTVAGLFWVNWYMKNHKGTEIR
jgi:hypothetical protein